MRKIYLYTFFDVPNYGAFFQCYALQEYLKANGYEVHVLNYQNKHILSGYSKVRVKRLIDLRYYLELWKRYNKKRCFKLFVRKYIDTTELIIRNSLKAIDCDCIVVGSDQVWNTKISGNDSTYFLDFLDGNTEIKKVAFSVSCGGEYEFLQNERYVKLIRNFDKISVREKDMQLALESFGVSCSVTIDPTLLGIDYSIFMAKGCGANYTAVYYVSYNKQFEATLLKIRAASKDRFCNLGHRFLGFAFNPKVIDPQFWLSSIASAKRVITNSFHGVVFSVIFEKQFIYIQNNLPSDERVIGLLESLGLEEAIWFDDEKMMDIKESKIDYSVVREKLRLLRKYAENFLFEI